MIKRTPYYHQLLAAGATLEDRIGFEASVVFSSVREEHMAVRERVGMFDVYYQVAVEVRGRDAERLLQRMLVNDIRRIPDGGVLYSSLCNDAGGMVDDLTCFRFSGAHFWLCPTPSRVQAVVRHLEAQTGSMNVCVTNLGYANAYLSLQGPSSRELLAALTDVDLATDKLPYYHFTRASLAGIPNAVISRTGYSGELGYELFFPVEYAEHLWKTVAAAGSGFGIRPCGLKSLRSLRIEKKFVLYGLDIDESTDPLSAGLSWTVRFDDRDFIGRPALERIRVDGPARQLRLLDAGTLQPIVRGEPIFAGGQKIGTVTSGEPGYALGRSFAFAYLPKPYATKGTSLDIEVKIGDQPTRIEATVLGEPPYDPKRERATA
jgi:aminomethyltransferase